MFGLRDNGSGGIKERLFRKENVTLQKAVDFARASEAFKQHMKSLRDRDKKTEFSEVNVVKKRSSYQTNGSCRRSDEASGSN